VARERNGWNNYHIQYSQYKGEIDEDKEGFTVVECMDGECARPDYEQIFTDISEGHMAESISVSEKGIVVVGFPGYEDITPSTIPSSPPSLSSIPSLSPMDPPVDRLLAERLLDADDIFGIVKVYTLAGLHNAWNFTHDFNGGSIKDKDASFGKSVAISRDGLTIAIGNPGHNNAEGQVQVHTFDGENWTEDAVQILPPNANAGKFGEKIGLSHDGSHLVIAAALPNESSLNIAYVYRKSGLTWEKIPDDVGGDKNENGVFEDSFDNGVFVDSENLIVHARGSDDGDNIPMKSYQV